jgi:hypothetical protein
MPDQNRKGKMISLRISEVEYAALHATYASYGARNVSDLARLALQRVMSKPQASEAGLTAEVGELRQRLNEVEVHLALLMGAGKGNAVCVTSEAIVSVVAGSQAPAPALPETMELR